MRIHNLFTWAAIAATLFLSSCNKDETPVPDAIKSYSGIVVNQGNWGEYNGSLSLYNEGDNTVKNLAFDAVNKRPLSSLVESFVTNGRVGLVICNNPSKIEVVGMDSLQVLSAPLQGGDVVNPRYGAVVGQYAYVTCWGSETTAIGKYPNSTYDILSFSGSYLLKIDLNTYQIVKKVPCGADAEGIIAYNNKLYVAVLDGVVVIDPATDTELAHIKHSTLSKFAKHLVVDKNGKVWYSVSGSGFGIINTSSFTLESELSVPNAGGYIVASRAKDKILFVQQTNDAFYMPVKGEIFAMNVDTRTVGQTPIYTGKQLIGVGVNPKTGNIYTAEIWNYSINSTLKVLNESGTVLNEQTVGVAASRFIFF